MTTPVFVGQIEKGKLLLDTPARYLVHLSTLEGRRVEIIVRKQRSQRSLAQNNAYWGLVVEMLAAKTGYGKETMHLALKEKFASRIDEKTGLVIVESTAEMDTKRFSQYYEDIQKWAWEFLELKIPAPGECDYVPTQAPA